MNSKGRTADAIFLSASIDCWILTCMDLNIFFRGSCDRELVSPLFVGFMSLEGENECILHWNGYLNALCAFIEDVILTTTIKQV